MGFVGNEKMKIISGVAIIKKSSTDIYLGLFLSESDKDGDIS